MLTDNLYWLWLQGVLGYADTRIHNVLENYSTAKEFFNAPQHERATKCNLTPLQIKRASKLTLSDFEDILQECNQSGIKIVNILDEHYPKRLYNLPDSPTVIYVKGELPKIDDEVAITIVGPREEKISELGKKSAYALGLRLTLTGCLVVSGGATGADRYAHLGALRAGGKTVAVLGCGINNDYLKANAKLREHIAQNGCLISEYPPQLSATRSSFPVRNRLLSALSLGTVVVEAGVKSGALITATHAVNQGKDVFVVPGNVGNRYYEGSNRLIQDGAKTLLTVVDILEEYIGLYPDKIDVKKAFDIPKVRADMPPAEEDAQSTSKSHSKEDTSAQKKSNAGKKQIDLSELSAEAAKLYAAIKESPFFADDLIAASGIDPSSALSALTELEMYGVITAIPGGRYKVTENDG